MVLQRDGGIQGEALVFYIGRNSRIYLRFSVIVFLFNLFCLAISKGKLLKFYFMYHLWFYHALSHVRILLLSVFKV
jgi:hypothetical protein